MTPLRWILLIIGVILILVILGNAGILNIGVTLPGSNIALNTVKEETPGIEQQSPETNLPSSKVIPPTDVQPTPTEQKALFGSLGQTAYVKVSARFARIENNVVVVNSTTPGDTSAVALSFIASDKCGEISPYQLAQYSYVAFQHYSIPIAVGMATFLSESGMVHFEMDPSGSGMCRLNTNPIGPAYGISQVYRPSEPNPPKLPLVHPEIQLGDVNNAKNTLHDPLFSIKAGCDILVGSGGNSWDTKVYNYKGEYWDSNYYNYLASIEASGGFSIDGKWFSITNPEIPENMQKEMEAYFN